MEVTEVQLLPQSLNRIFLSDSTFYLYLSEAIVTVKVLFPREEMIYHKQF